MKKCQCFNEKGASTTVASADADGCKAQAGSAIDQAASAQKFVVNFSGSKSNSMVTFQSCLPPFLGVLNCWQLVGKASIWAFITQSHSRLKDEAVLAAFPVQSGNVLQFLGVVV